MSAVDAEQKAKTFLSTIGLAAIVSFFVGILQFEVNSSACSVDEGSILPRRNVSMLSMVAFGDVNLGRYVGQEILKADTLFPFANVKDSLSRFDVVFVNLESQLSDQNGRTEHPHNNLIFTGPPAGGFSLKRGGVTIVSTANNHALDFGVKALKETNRFLDQAGVLHIGTSEDSTGLYTPVVVERKGIRVAFFACTDVMNFEQSSWKKNVAEADTGKLLPAIRGIRDSVDAVVVSYHGGEEYADHPTRRTREFARQVIDGGADVFLGHHPHVPYGLELYGGKYIVHSLGNFVFRQPDRYWTQRSYGFSFVIEKDAKETRIVSVRCIPVRVGFQPAFATGQHEIDTIMERIAAFSTQSITQQLTW